MLSFIWKLFGKGTDFVIFGRVLKKYIGSGEEAVIPEKVERIAPFAFAHRSSKKLLKVWKSNNLFHHWALPFSERRRRRRSRLIRSFVKSLLLRRKLNTGEMFESTKIRYAYDGDYDSFLRIGKAKSYFVASLTFPEKLRSIGKNAFINACLPHTLSLPDSIVSIEENAFAFCWGLQQLTLPQNSEVQYGKNTFHDCTTLRKVLLSPGMTVIPEGMFSMCSEMEEAELPETVSEIENEAFMLCSKFVIPKLPEGLKLIGSEAFEGCRAEGSLTVPKNVTSVGERAFSCCAELTEIEIAGSPEIGKDAFPYDAVIRAPYMLIGHFDREYRLGAAQGYMELCADGYGCGRREALAYEAYIAKNAGSIVSEMIRKSRPSHKAYDIYLMHMIKKEVLTKEHIDSIFDSGIYSSDAEILSLLLSCRRKTSAVADNGQFLL